VVELDVDVVELDVDVVDELVLVVLVDVVEELEDVLVVLVDVVLVLELVDVKSSPLHVPPSYLIHKLVSVSKNSSPGFGLEGTVLDSYTFPISLLNVVVILITL